MRTLKEAAEHGGIKLRQELEKNVAGSAGVERIRQDDDI